MCLTEVSEYFINAIDYYRHMTINMRKCSCLYLLITPLISVSGRGVLSPKLSRASLNRLKQWPKFLI